MSENAGSGDNTPNAGAGSESFLDSLGEDLKGNEVFKGIEDVKGLGTKFAKLSASNTDLTTQHEELKSSIPVLPENVDGYTFDVPKDFTVDDADFGAFKEFALKNKFTEKQYQEAMNFVVARDQRVLKEQKATTDTAIKAQKNEMGDKYDSNLELVQKVLRKFGGEEFAKNIEVGNDPETFKFLLQVGKAISEDVLELGGAPGSGDARPKGVDGKPILAYKDMKGSVSQ